MAARMAVLSLSVPQLVKTISSAEAPSRRASVLARRADVGGHLAAEGVHAGGVAVVVGEIGQHGLEHLRGHLGGGVVVEVNDVRHHGTSSTTSSGLTSSRSLFST